MFADLWRMESIWLLRVDVDFGPDGVQGGGEGDVGQWRDDEGVVRPCRADEGVRDILCGGF